MRDIRQGNDIAVIWSLMSDGKLFQLQGRALKLYLKNMYGSKEITDFSVKGNQIHWTFWGKDQKATGRYSLTLVANENEVGMITVDTCDFVRLVSHSCAVCCDSDSPNVGTETIELTSTLEYVANVEQGGSYDDTALWAEVSRLEKDKADKKDIPTKVSDLEIDVELGKSYDDTELRNAVSELEKDKVDKEEGKGLSSNDYTNTDKQKLAGLQNYDDTALRTAIQGKQNTIVDLELIRSGASLGATALQSIPSTYATKNDVANAIAEAITNVLNKEV